MDIRSSGGFPQQQQQQVVPNPNFVTDDTQSVTQFNHSQLSTSNIIIATPDKHIKKSKELSKSSSNKIVGHSMIIMSDSQMLANQPSIEEIEVDWDERLREVIHNSSEINCDVIHQIEQILKGNEEHISHATLYQLYCTIVDSLVNNHSDQIPMINFLLSSLIPQLPQYFLSYNLSSLLKHLLNLILACP